MCCPPSSRAVVDLIYIDPPYNTGNDFAYVDSFRTEDGGRATRHEAWVAMMRPRLMAMREVLADTGAMFVSIDDNEAAHLRLLLDEVFGEANFLAQIVVNLNPKGRQLGGGFATSHEYLLAYARDAERCVLDASSPDTVDAADFPLAHRRRPRASATSRCATPTRSSTRSPRRPCTSPCTATRLTGAVARPTFDGGQEIKPVFGDGRPAVWRWSRPRIDERPTTWCAAGQRAQRVDRVDVFQRDWLHRDGGRAQEAAHHLARRGGRLDRHRGRRAEGPHRPRLRVAEADRPGAPDPRDDAAPTRVVLDYFAGSGTTGSRGRARQRSRRRRRHCLRINPAEPTRPGSNADLAGYRTVADITRARLAAGGRAPRARPLVEQARVSV